MKPGDGQRWEDRIKVSADQNYLVAYMYGGPEVGRSQPRIGCSRRRTTSWSKTELWLQQLNSIKLFLLDIAVARFKPNNGLDQVVDVGPMRGRSCDATKVWL